MTVFQTKGLLLNSKGTSFEQNWYNVCEFIGEFGQQASFTNTSKYLPSLFDTVKLNLWKRSRKGNEIF